MMDGSTPSPEVAVPLALPIEAGANELLLRSPLALVVGMLLDQQVPLERAFRSPYDLQERLGHELDASELAGYDPAALTELFARRPALHRYPKAMAERVQQLCRLIVDRYQGDAALIWTGVDSGTELRRRVADLPGFGAQKAQIFVALLGKQFGVQPPGWREAAGGYGLDGVHRSVADIVDAESLGLVRAYKQQLKAAGRAANG